MSFKSKGRKLSLDRDEQFAVVVPPSMLLLASTALTGLLKSGMYSKKERVSSPILANNFGCEINFFFGVENV